MLRLVVLLCGVIAGIVGLGFGWWGERAALVDIYRLATPQFAATVLAIHAGSAVSIAGGLLVLANPRVGGMMMLASATAWLLIVALLGDGLGASMAALIGTGAAGGLLAFLPSLSRPPYRLERTGDEPRALGGDWPDLVGTSRSDVGSGAPAQVGQAAAPEARPVILDTSEDHSRPFEPSQWRFEAPDGGPAEFAPEPEAPPASPAEPEPIAADPEPWLPREDRSEHRVAYEVYRGRIRPLQVMAAPSRRRPARTIAGIGALAVLVLGLPILLVVDQQRRGGDGPAAAAVAAAADATATSVAAPPAAEGAGAPAAASVAARLPSDAPQQFNEPGIAPRSGSARLPVAAAYQSPFDYCAGMGDVDAPEPGAVAAGLPAELVAGVREVTKMPEAEVLWRCMGQAVWVCAQPPGGVACARVPTPAERQAFCQAHADATDIVAAGGRWSCNGVDPVVPGGDQRTTDPRGFDRLAWLGLSKAPKAAGGG